LLNLINNAIKFTSKGNVYLRVRDLTGEGGDTIQRLNQIYFAVQDSGIGISPDSQKKLFMPFAQADSSISRKYGGTGLGLAICKRLIEAMGGAISINSKESEGSTFFFTLSMPTGSEVADPQNPATQDTMETKESHTSFKHSHIQNTNPILVLVVDDNGINQRVASGFIEKLGGQAMTANCGADALDMLARYPFDMILMDLQLPDMSGIEVTEFIRKLSIPGKANVPIVALTGNTDSEDMKACFDAGMNDFAAKPITYEKIAELLTKIQNQTYFNQKTSQILDFDTLDTADDITFVDPIKENSISLSDTDTSFLSDENFDIHEDDDDSFALAVRKFEEQEQSASTSPLPSLQGTFTEVGLDEAILKSLRSGLSVAQIQEILVSFYEKADELIADIGNTYLADDTVNLYARAHELKGMAGNFGFSGLSRMCTTIEKAAKDSALDTVKDTIDHLGESYAVARGRLNEWLNEA
jgi:CheY-like chemotaxis protein/HPt (histidine-containing phosphotransfer) domain-containing protein